MTLLGSEHSILIRSKFKSGEIFVSPPKEMLLGHLLGSVDYLPMYNEFLQFTKCLYVCYIHFILEYEAILVLCLLVVAYTFSLTASKSFKCFDTGVKGHQVPLNLCKNIILLVCLSCCPVQLSIHS